ncbi:MAG: ATP-binding cassette domain-containing protein [Paludibacteraceae bacterium]|nr:ATP-binding cassette domain-containing protein [Paludibacteraceae bacterium]
MSNLFTNIIQQEVGEKNDSAETTIAVEANPNTSIQAFDGDEHSVTMNDGQVDVLELKNIVLRFGDFTLFNGINFNIPDFLDEGQFITIMGGSGSGKSQLARVISGLTKPTSGEVYMYGKRYDDNTHIPMVFQQYSSFPWMTVLDNVALPLKMKGVPKSERYAKAMETIRLVGLEGHEKKWAQYPMLSGGQLQRVSLARNLVADSQIMILDEYSSGLDTASKSTMQDILLELFYDRKIDRTFIMITHDINEAVYLSQRVHLLDSKTHTFAKTVEIKFDGKRTRDIVGTSQYKAYYKEIEEFFAKTE